jgi:lipoprotein LpqH
MASVVKNRFVAVAGAASVSAVIIGGCSSPPAEPQQPAGALPPGTAEVTVNGKRMGPTDAVNCAQTQWLWIMEAGDKTAGVTAVVQSGEMLTAKSVQIRNLDGFTGSYWDGQGGNADASIAGNTWTISGTVDGFNADKPKRATATFKVKANC